MRLVIWHGYLLGGTGSNVYTRQLARAWALAGHDVVVASQDPRPGDHDLGGAAAVRPDTGPLLPVFVADRYAGRDVRLLGDCSPAQLRRWVGDNAAAVRELLPADLVLCNHVLLGGPVGQATGAAYAVKVHGSELEYAMRDRPDLAAWGAASLAGARATLVGSEHMAGVLREVCGPVPGVHVVPPGVDVDAWRPMPRDAALAALIEAAERDDPTVLHPADDGSDGGSAGEADGCGAASDGAGEADGCGDGSSGGGAAGDARWPDAGNAARFEAFLGADQSGPVAVYFGKLMPQKGVHLLIDAVRGTGIRLVIAGFGPQRAALERQAADAGVPALFTGALEHRHLAPLLALADACVVPSVFPEAFGMVAAEAAATGCPPLVADHSGLAEIGAALASAYPPSASDLTTFRSGDVADLRHRLLRLLALPEADRAAVRSAARTVVVERWSWAGVGERILSAAGLPTAGPPAGPAAADAADSRPTAASVADPRQVAP